ncbi:MAG: hypothetical protein IJ873_07165 [Lachnospiraceae bacterium]|nr:hypothetical protein [Lachnospiraceae bacterium]
MKRILAFIGVGLLVFMYVLTLIFALSGSENFFGMMMADIAATILVPIVLYGYVLVYNVIKDNNTEEAPEEEELPETEETDGEQK